MAGLALYASGPGVAPRLVGRFATSAGWQAAVDLYRSRGEVAGASLPVVRWEWEKLRLGERDEELRRRQAERARLGAAS